MKILKDQTTNRSSDSIWQATAIPPLQTETLNSDKSCDVAVIGAGYTGLSAALHLAKAGKSVVVLEQNHVGYGGSGRNTGMVNSGIWVDPDEVISTIGMIAGTRLNQALAHSNVTVFDIIKRHGIPCHATQNGSINLAFKGEDEAKLQNRCQQMLDLGCNTRFVSAIEAKILTGADGFYGGLIDENAGTINPLSYVRGLAKTAVDAGAMLFENQNVSMPTREGERWHVSTNGNTISAAFVIVATNAYTNRLFPELAQMTIPMPFLHIATDPLGKYFDEVLADQKCAWDTRSTAFCFRKDPEGRLILGTIGSVSGGRSSLSRQWAHRQLKKHFPQISGVPVRKAWVGRIGYSPLHVPQYVKLGEKLIAPLGYNGRGIGPGTVFGRNLAEYFLSGFDQNILYLPLSQPKSVKLRILRAKVFDLGATGLRFLGRR
ncbi:MAG: FAD-binding oxidoreductase [Litoreibacter sp.]